MGCVFSFVHGILMDALLQNTLLIASHVGKSSMFWSTSSSSSRFFSSPSPFRVLRLILSGDKFLVNLERCFRICFLMIPAMVPARLERRSLAVPHSFLSSRRSPLGPASQGRRRGAGALALGRDSRPWPRPQPPQPPPRTRSMTLRPPRPPPAPSWLQHHLRDRGRGEEPGAERTRGGRNLWEFRGSSRAPFGLLRLLPCFCRIA